MSVAKRMTLRRRKPRRTLDHDVFEKEFAIESLKSERLRVTILMGAIRWRDAKINRGQDLQD